MALSRPRTIAILMSMPEATLRLPLSSIARFKSTIEGAKFSFIRSNCVSLVSLAKRVPRFNEPRCLLYMPRAMNAA